MFFQEPVDILILSNGPGEVTTWVRPVVRALRAELGDDREKVRISVVLSPCPNASGKEAAIARSYPEVDRVQAPEHFSQFLLWGKTAANWAWHRRGVVLFLGGDQFFTVVVGRRLGYRTVIYAESEARWLKWIDQFGLVRSSILAQSAQKYADKLTVVGDLMAEVTAETDQSKVTQAWNFPPDTELIGLLPGSKPAKLAQGVPLMLAIAEQIHTARPQTRFAIPVAPTLDLISLSQFANPEHNPVLLRVGGKVAKLIAAEPERPYLETEAGLRVELWTHFPAHTLLQRCCLCLTTVGANTAELGSLAVPMLVLLPTQQLDAMRAWDGLPGILANLPIVGAGIATVYNWFILQRLGLLAWPNIWAGKEIVPELVGQLQPQVIAELVLDLLNHPQKLKRMRDDLYSVRGEAGAAQKLTELVKTELSLFR